VTSGVSHLQMVESSDTPRPRRRWRTWLIGFAVSLALVLNAMAIMQARGLCRYVQPTAKTTYLSRLNGFGKASVLICGPTVRRQLNTQTPRDFGMPYKSKRFPGARGIQLEAWRVSGNPRKPVVLMFPGYGASKDTLLRAAAEFHAMGNELCLVDFHGAGGSGGTTTTVGFDEADDVIAATSQLESNRSYVLYGTSMGAAATLRAVHLGKVKPQGMILEAPFDRFLNTIGNRFENMRLPEFPFAHLLVFWSGATNGFNGFNHNPIDYARSVQCPTLLMQGEYDELVGAEVPAKFGAALGSHGTIRTIPGAWHAYLVRSQPEVWRSNVREFLAELN
jgi:alpha-beta hydrolase superfamily lysophospholipase